MRLKHLHIITEYKNLKNFKLNFDGESFIDLFVGKNGSGKSNLFEAIIEVFRHLYEFDKTNDKSIFNYKIQYDLIDKEVTVEWNNNVLKVNGKTQKSINKSMLPDNILVYYSGHNDKITEIVKTYQEKFSKKIKNADFNESRRFVGIGAEYKNLLLAIMLMQDNDNNARRFICKKLNILPEIPNLKITLNRPVFAKKSVKIEEFNPTTHFWGTEGITKDFLEKLTSCIKEEYKHSDIYDSKSETYSFTIDGALYGEKIAKDKNITEQFLLFDNLKTLSMLNSISAPVKLDDGSQTFIDQFSDGQFQSIYIYSIIEIFKNRNCITLLDEPDSFLHPEWQFEFLKQVFEITDNDSANNHVLMSSHSASTIAKHIKNEISLFEIKDNVVVHKKASKQDVIKSLSTGLISFSEEEARLNIKFVLKNIKGPVLFTEGITDEMILETAWGKLYPNNPMPFDIQNAFSCSFMRNLIKQKELYTDNPDRIFFSLFDFDTAYNDWNQLGADIETNARKCLVKKYKEHESYALLLPVPEIISICDQVLNPNRTGDTYKDKSLLTIEHLLYEAPEAKDFFSVDEDRTDGFIKFTSDSKKVKFARDIVPGIDVSYFKHFKPIFDFIVSKCN